MINEMNAAVFPENLLARRKKKKRTQILIDAKILLGEKSWQTLNSLHVIMK